MDRISRCVVHQNNTSAFKPGYEGGLNKGVGGRVVVGKRLVAGAEHWGHMPPSKSYIMAKSGMMELTYSGSRWRPSDLGYSSSNVDDDMFIYEVNEEIPDECIPWLMT